MELFQLAMFALPVVCIALVVARMRRVFHLIRDPAQLGQLLSLPVRASLEAAGVDPDRLDFEQLQALENDPTLKQQVTDELQVAMRQLFSGKALVSGSSPAMSAHSQTLPQGGERGNRPLPIDHASRATSPQWILAVVIALAIGVAVAFFQR